MRKDVTAVVVGETGEQVSRPHFIRFTDRDKMRRLHRERQRLNARLAELRRDGRDYTDEFKRVQAEYERVNNKIQHNREQLVHDVVNQVVALALVYNVDAVVTRTCGRSPRRVVKASCRGSCRAGRGGRLSRRSSTAANMSAWRQSGCRRQGRAAGVRGAAARDTRASRRITMRRCGGVGTSGRITPAANSRVIEITTVQGESPPVHGCG